VVRSRVSATRHGRLRYETALVLASDCPLTNDDLSAIPSHEPVVEPVVDAEIVDVEVIEPDTSANEWT
jgi:hypothetical protein